MFCSNCGSAIPVGAEFCANCGKPAREESKINVSKATIRSLVAMILGIMGTIVGLAITIFSTIFLQNKPEIPVLSLICFCVQNIIQPTPFVKTQQTFGHDAM